jgi:hypothetical protein
VVLLTVAFWTKQSALFPAVAAVVWLAWAARAGLVTWRRVLGFAGVLAAVNGLIYVGFQVASDGWFATELVKAPNRHAFPVSYRDAVKDLWHSVAPTLALLAVLAAALGATAGRGGPRWRVRLRRFPATPAGQVASVLVVFIAIDVLPALGFRRAEGAVHNQYLGICWALVMLAALGIGVARQRPGASFAVTGAVLALFALSEVRPLKRELAKGLILTPNKYGHALVEEIPAALHDYAASRHLYHPALADLGVRDRRWLYPGHENIQQLLASGHQPRYVLNALLDRRFDAVYLFEDNRLREIGAGTGKWEDNYIWKLNQVIGAGYRPAVGAPAAARKARTIHSFFSYNSVGPLERRPGPDPASWMRYCFGPFRIGAVSWQIRRGGGFWCRPGGRGATMTLVRTRAVDSELRSEQRAAWLEGSVTVTIPHDGGRFAIRLADWRVEGERVGPSVRLVDASPIGRYGDLVVAGARVRLALGGVFSSAGAIVRDPLHLDGAFSLIPFRPLSPVSLWASFDSGASFDLHDLVLRRP